MTSGKPLIFNDKIIRESLSRIVETSEFKKAYRLRQLLVHLIEKQLAGEESDLKGYNIGLDVFEKGDGFDPDTDTIVRVQMVRLRRMLEHYYLTTGKDDPVNIEIPKGRYVPAYLENKRNDKGRPFRRVKEAAGKLGSRLKEWISGDPYMIGLVVGVVGLMSYLASSYVFQWIAPDTGVQKIVMKRENYRMPRGPSVAVFPFRNETGKLAHTSLVRGFPAHIIHTLTRFRELFILAPSTTLAHKNSKMLPFDRARKLGVDYALTGRFRVNDDKLSLSAFLTRVDTGRVIWSKNFDKGLTGTNLHEIQSRIAASIARELGQPYGVINRLETLLRKQNKKLTYSAYDCILQFFDYAQVETEEKHLNVRKCLKTTTQDNPGHAQTWAALSWMFVEEHRNGYNVTPKVRGTALDRAFSAARKSIVLDPDDAFNHRRMASVLISRDGVEAARDSIMKAADLNPNDADVMADVGWIIKNTGQWDEAYYYANKAIRLNPGHPPWYLETPILYHYRNQDCKNAYRKAMDYNLLAAKTPFREVLVIISGILCEQADISKSVGALNTLYPSFLMNPRKLLLDHAVPKELLPEIIGHLQEAGVAVDK